MDNSDIHKKYEVTWWIEDAGYGYGESFNSYDKAYELFVKMRNKNCSTVKLQEILELHRGDNL